MELLQFRYNRDNFGYLLISASDCLIIDGGAVDAICQTIAKRSLSVVGVTNTHSHGDHVQGNAALMERLTGPHLSHETLAEEGGIRVGEVRVSVFPTPGHTMDSVCFHVGDTLITGDTLFNGTIGNCFSGDLDAFHHSICRLMAFPDGTRVLAGHDYVSLSIGFARSIEDENPDLEAFSRAYDPDRVESTMGVERRINPYLRFNDPKMIRIMTSRGLPVETELERWYSLMELY